ncbi:PBECR2 nuclease fold domain-containing protein [Propionivibrio sp.]|uniref:PBECR2 nuclease fold domain-containing protein n=1 Tax=Propionivibrio sp. TaxID=2212460 RepID=UPI003BF1213C
MNPIPDNIRFFIFKSFAGHKGRKGKRGGSAPSDTMEMPAPRTMNIEILPAMEDDRFYLDRVMAEFGAKWNETIELTDLIPYRRIVSKDIFTNHLTGDTKINKNGRAIYARYIAETIKHPDEVWLDSGGHQDRGLNFLGRYTAKKGILHIVAVFKENAADEVWIGWSGFQHHRPEYCELKRHGERIYRRP